jgi:hypothetical protein
MTRPPCILRPVVRGATVYGYLDKAGPLFFLFLDPSLPATLPCTVLCFGCIGLAPYVGNSGID